MRHEGTDNPDVLDPDSGTTIRILLPEVQAGAASEKPVAAPCEQKTHSGTILLIEDEPLVRNVTQRVLQRAGYKIIPACNGAEGVALFNQHVAEIALVLTDMIMPELSGPDVAAAVRAVRPGVPLLFMSGYSEESVLRRGLASGLVHMLHKPFTPDMLIDKVYDVMNLGGGENDE